MSISIKNILTATPGDWDYIWEKCSYSTYFHSREWAELWQIYTEGKIRPAPKMIIFSDGKRALVLLSYSKRMKGFVKNYISSPGGTFGGWISTDALEMGHSQLLVDYFNRLGSITWRLNPYDPLVHKCNFSYTQKDETHVLDLKGGFDAIHKLWTKGHKSAARKAHKAGVTIQKAVLQDEWRDYYAIYQDSLRRWGDKTSSRYSWKLFEIIAGRQSKNIELWLAKYEDKNIAGALCFYAKKHVVYWHGAAYSDYFKLRPVNLLMYEVIKHACEQGYSWFDFNPSGGHEGVMKFKQSFGAGGLPSSLIVRESTLLKVLKAMRKIIKRKKYIKDCK
jgi:hypothetical protein